MKNNQKIIIIGSGPTGLSAALELAKNGEEVLILEKNSYIGGMATTIKRAGVLVDIGPHRFIPHNQRIKDFVEDLLKKRIILRNQESHFFWRGKWMRYPFRITDIIKKNSPFLLLNIVLSYSIYNLKLFMRKKKKIITYKDYLDKNFGPYLSENVFCPIAEKTWKIKSSKLAKDLAIQRVSLEGLMKTAIGLIFKKFSKKSDSLLYPAEKFAYFKDGFGSLSEGIGKEIKKYGGKIILNATVNKIIIKNNRCQSVFYERGQKIYKVNCKYLMATGPINQLPNYFSPALNFAQLTKAQKALKFRSLLLFYLVLNKPKVSNDISLFFPEKRFPFGRIFEQKNYGPDMISKDKTALGVEISCRENGDLWGLGDSQLAKKIIPLLEELKLIKKEEIINYFSLRFKDVYPVYDLDYRKNLDTLLREMDKIENLITNGRSGLFMYNNTHHSLEMGMLAAKHILNKGKLNDWKKIRKSFEDYRIIE